MTLPSRHQIFRAAVYLFIFSIPIYPDLSIRLMIVAIFCALTMIKKRRPFREWLRQGWDLGIYFIVLALGLLYSDDLDSGWHILEKNLSFIMLPFIFSRMEKEESNRLFMVFSAGVITASLICLGVATYRQFSMHVPQAFYYQELTAVIDSHPTYLAYYISFTIVFLLYLVFYNPKPLRQQVWIVVGVLFLACILMLTAGRTSFISMLLVFAFFSLKLLFEPYPISQKVQGVSVSLLLMVIIIFQSPYAQRILPQVLSGTHTLDKVKGDSWNRLVLWQSALDATPRIIWGVGTGNETSVMNDYYQAHGLTEYAESNFNAHNQFIQSILGQGLMGLLALLLILGRPLWLAVRRQHIFGILTFFPFLLYGISEVYLGRYQGIVFFGLLHQIFIWYYHHQPSSKVG